MEYSMSHKLFHVPNFTEEGWFKSDKIFSSEVNTVLVFVFNCQKNNFFITNSLFRFG